MVKPLTTICPACGKTIQNKEPGSVTYVKDITNPDFCECKKSNTIEIQIGKYSLRPVTVAVGIHPPYQYEEHIFIQYEDGEGMSVPPETFDAFFDELWKGF